MSASNGHMHSDTSCTCDRQGTFPWIPVLAVIGVAAGAVILAKKLQAGRTGEFSLDDAISQCDRAAHQLQDRMRAYQADGFAG
ncbi:MAG: hypothetical protein HZC36_02750 [Armatimonadetes bacterium]|nr:hypothetical protein [Armatimonadota bacterium]